MNATQLFALLTTALTPAVTASAPRAERASLWGPGEYDCVLSWRAHRNPPHWVIRPQQVPMWEFWSGKLQTPPLRLKVVPATARKRTLYLPKTTYLAASRLNARCYDLRCNKRDVEAVGVPVRDGHYLGTRIGRKGGASMLAGDALSLPDGGSVFDDPTNEQDAKTKPGDELTYTVEIFETNRPAGHAGMPGPGRDDYKTLWQRTFKVKVPAGP